MRESSAFRQKILKLLMKNMRVNTSKNRCGRKKCARECEEYGRTEVYHAGKSTVNQVGSIGEQILQEVNDLYLCMRVDNGDLLADRFSCGAVPHAEPSG